MSHGCMRIAQRKEKTMPRIDTIQPWPRYSDPMTRRSGGAEEAPVRNCPDILCQGFHFPAPGDHQAQSACPRPDPGNMLRIKELPYRLGIGAMRPGAGLCFNGQNVPSRGQDKVHLPSPMSAMEIEMGRVCLPRRPAQDLIEDIGFKNRSVIEAQPLREMPGKAGVCPINLWALYQPGGHRMEERPEQGHLVGNLEKSDIALHGIDCHTDLPGDLGIGEKLGCPSCQDILGQSELIEVCHPAQVCQVPLQ